MTSTLRTSSASTARNRPLTGDIKTSYVVDDHMGWLLCDGRGMDKVVFNLLFQVIGYTFGGSGNTFLLPNVKGRVMGSIGTVVDSASRTRTYVAGQSVGELDHKLTVNEMPAHNHNKSVASPGANTTADGITSVEANHTHGITDPGHTHTYTSPANANISGSGLVTFSASTTSGTTSSHTTGITVNPAGSHSHTISSNGNDEYHNNIQPTLFYGNTYIYSGVPISKDYPFIFPFTTGRNPVLI
jgi:microcystin-dependent protein